MRPMSQVSKGFTRFQPDDVIFAKITPCMENGKVAIVPPVAGNAAAGSTEFHVIRSEQLCPEYIFYYLVRRALREEARRNMSGSAGQMRVPTEFLRSLAIPVPPRDVQEALVKRIIDLFAEIDDGEVALGGARSGVETYRQALLKAAVTGELTVGWRRENPHAETGQDLLGHIMADRRKQWEEDPKNRKKKYISTPDLDTSDLPELPAGWVWTTTEILTNGGRGQIVIGPFGSDLKVSDYQESGVPLIFVRHIRTKDFKGTRPQFVSPEKAKQLCAHTALPGDILVTKMGDPPGDVAKYPDLAPAIITADCIRWRHHPYASADFLEAWINSFWGKAWIKSKTKGVAQQKITLELFRQMPVALPGASEQHQIVDLINAGFQFAGATEPLTDIKPLNDLRQSILSAAFRGKLI